MSSPDEQRPDTLVASPSPNEIRDPAMRRELIERRPDYAITHDWWIYLAAAGAGRIQIDNQSYLLYRQHGGNLLGRRNLFGRWRKYFMLYRLYGRNHELLRQMREFHRLYGERLSPDNRLLLLRYLHYRDSLWSRLRLVFCRRIGRLRLGDDLLWRAVCLLDLL